MITNTCTFAAAAAVIAAAALSACSAPVTVYPTAEPAQATELPPAKVTATSKGWTDERIKQTYDEIKEEAKREVERIEESHGEITVEEPSPWDCIDGLDASHCPPDGIGAPESDVDTCLYDLPAPACGTSAETKPRIGER